jgi:hypothetical protein
VRTRSPSARCALVFGEVDRWRRQLVKAGHAASIDVQWETRESDEVIF